MHISAGRGRDDAGLTAVAPCGARPRRRRSLLGLMGWEDAGLLGERDKTVSNWAVYTWNGCTRSLRVSSISFPFEKPERDEAQAKEHWGKLGQISLCDFGVVSVLGPGVAGGEMARDWEGIPPRERRQMEEIRQLDSEELNVVVLDSDDDGDDDEEEEEEDPLRSVGSFRRLDNVVAGRDRSPTSLHSYLGAVDDTPGRKMTLLDAGAVLSLPMLFLHGVVLFPEATLPLRLIHTSLVVAVEKALRHVDAPNTIGVVLMHRRLNHQYANASVGTTAEIRQLGRLDDGSVNVLTRGQQRFRLIRHWEDVDGVVWGDVQIIEEDTPLRTPRDAFAQLAACSSFRPHNSSPVMSSDVSPIKQQNHMDSKLHCDSPSHTNTSVMKTFVDDDDDDIAATCSLSSARTTHKKQRHQCTPASYSKQPVQASLSFWPRWAYEMYDSYTLARKAAELWKRTIKNSNMDDHVRKPDLLSFYIGSKLPVSESGRQKLLEIDGIVYRLQKEIQLLKIFDIIKCRCCKSKIAKRSDLVEMSSDGPVGTHVNPHGFVHSIITVNNATGLALEGTSSKEYSWFPGYSWTIGACANCGNNIGWFFKTTKKHLCPTYFWGIRTAQIADVVEEDDLEE